MIPTILSTCINACLERITFKHQTFCSFLPARCNNNNINNKHHFYLLFHAECRQLVSVLISINHWARGGTHRGQLRSPTWGHRDNIFTASLTTGDSYQLTNMQVFKQEKTWEPAEILTSKKKRKFVQIWKNNHWMNKFYLPFRNSTNVPELIWRK